MGSARWMHVRLNGARGRRGSARERHQLRMAVLVGGAPEAGCPGVSTIISGRVPPPVRGEYGAGLMQPPRRAPHSISAGRGGRRCGFSCRLFPSSLKRSNAMQPVGCGWCTWHLGGQGMAAVMVPCQGARRTPAAAEGRARVAACALRGTPHSSGFLSPTGRVRSKRSVLHVYRCFYTSMSRILLSAVSIL
jgi:hypothetical protein